MQEQKNLDLAVEWIQRRLLTDAGRPLSDIVPDAPRRTGQFSIESTSAEWERRTDGGKRPMTNAEYNTINVETGSSCNRPVVCVHCEKQNNGVFHCPHGHTTHFFVQIIKAIREFRKDCDWRLYLRGFAEHLETVRGEVKENMNITEIVRGEELKKQITRVRTKVTLTTNKLRKLEEKDHLYAWEEDHYIALTCNLADLEEELEEAINDRHAHA